MTGRWTWADRPDWQADAACLDVDASVFFPEGRGGFTHADTARAKAICAVCPVRVECLNYALDNGEGHGVWGGKSPGERRKMRRVRRVA